MIDSMLFYTIFENKLSSKYNLYLAEMFTIKSIYVLTYNNKIILFSSVFGYLLAEPIERLF